MTVEALKETIAGLPEEERRSLAAWINEFDYDDWDREMGKDFSPGGRGPTCLKRQELTSRRAALAVNHDPAVLGLFQRSPALRSRSKP
jgi:hypothetical protein